MNAFLWSEGGNDWICPKAQRTVTTSYRTFSLRLSNLTFRVIATSYTIHPSSCAWSLAARQARAENSVRSASP